MKLDFVDIKGQRISWLGHLERMEEDRMPKKIFTQELERTRRKGRMERGSRKRSSSAGSEKIESWWQIGKNGRTLFDRPNPTMGCSANERRRRRRRRFSRQILEKY